MICFVRKLKNSHKLCTLCSRDVFFLKLIYKMLLKKVLGILCINSALIFQSIKLRNF
jgi:hypothetical protein